jgi:leucyl-tRNA synthetase
LRASQFSKDLYDGLDDPTLQNWRDIIKIQKNWIGEPNGTNIDFKMAEDQNDVLTAWTDMPEFINEVAFIGVSSGHLLDRKELIVSQILGSEEDDWKEIRVLNQSALHPSTKEKIPI